MSDTPQSADKSESRGNSVWIFVVLAILVAALVVWAKSRSGREELPREGEAPVLPPVSRPYADVTPVALAKAAEPIQFLEDSAKVFPNVPGYVYGLARLATLAGRPTTVEEAAVLSRMAFEFNYSARNAALTNLFIDRSATLFVRNAGLEVDRFQTTVSGPKNVDDAQAFLEGHLGAGRAVLFDHFEWGLFIRDEVIDDKPSFTAIGVKVSPQSGSKENWRGRKWWLHFPSPDNVHNLVAVTHVYEQDSRVDEVVRAARSAVRISKRTITDTSDLPPSYVQYARGHAAGIRSYVQLASDLESGEDMTLWQAGFPIQRIEFARHSAGLYFERAADLFEGVEKEALLQAAKAYLSEHQIWQDYIGLGEKPEQEADEWVKKKVELVRQASEAQFEAGQAFVRFFAERGRAGADASK